VTDNGTQTRAEEAAISPTEELFLSRVVTLPADQNVVAGYNTNTVTSLPAKSDKGITIIISISEQMYELRFSRQ
jgi:hypothetical protein